MKECDKLLEVQEESQNIGAFLDWLTGTKEFVLAQWAEEGEFLDPVGYVSFESLLAEYFDIDLKKVEEEKQEILRELRGDR